jgi:hypothetical protein
MWFQLVIAILAVWRITHLIQAEDGPWDMIFKIRKLAGNGFLGSLMDCFYCLSIWVALPFGYCIGYSWLNRFMLWMAYSAGAILLNKFFEKKEEEENH